jgi:hypothetical protein
MVVSEVVSLVLGSFIGQARRVSHMYDRKLISWRVYPSRANLDGYKVGGQSGHMSARPLYEPHSTALTVLHGDLENLARGSTTVFVGTAGSLLERQNAGGFRFYARQYYDGDGRKREQYVSGPVGDAAADATAEALRGRIDEVKSATVSLRLLGREGYALADAKTYATLAALHNHSVFRAGGVLIGSHAFGVLLNQLGVRSAAYATEDVDIARREGLAFSEPPAVDFLTMLRESGIDFVEVPTFDPRQPSSSFKQRGRGSFHVDLLVPSHDETFPTVPVPELRAHATGVPYLAYLLGETQAAVLLAREGCCLVRVPTAERYAIHKLIVSSLRVHQGAKDESERALGHAAVLAAVLGERFPGALEEAVSRVPSGAVGWLRSGVARAAPLLEAAHPRALAELAG